jgi:hypothetical protein
MFEKSFTPECIGSSGMTAMAGDINVKAWQWSTSMEHFGYLYIFSSRE